MKKTTKPASKKPAQKKPAAKKSGPKPKRKAQGPSELMQVVARLDAIAEKLAQATERLTQSVLQPSGTQPLPPENPIVEEQHQHADEHADDVEVDQNREER